MADEARKPNGIEGLAILKFIKAVTDDEPWKGLADMSEQQLQGYAQKAIKAAGEDAEQQGIVVTTTDWEEGTIESECLTKTNFVLVYGEQMEVTHCQSYSNGTTQLTIKRKENAGD